MGGWRVGAASLCLRLATSMMVRWISAFNGSTNAHSSFGTTPPSGARHHGFVLVVVVAAAVVGAAADRLGELAALVDLADEEVEPLLDRRPVGALAAELVLALVRDEV